MSDWNDAIYETYDRAESAGLSHEEAELVVNEASSRWLMPMGTVWLRCQKCNRPRAAEFIAIGGPCPHCYAKKGQS
jgi:hypothetical protein